ncbi:unnamed protein product [Closterium sp. Yama58-4]|nr:unnamed protein product [Closterium sp. Yama58-4]
MASKRLLHHVTSFSELEPISFFFDDPQWKRLLAFILKRTALNSIDVKFTSLEDLETLSQFMASSSGSLASLCLRPVDSIARRPIQCKLIDLHALQGFQQLQRLKLGRGRWELRSANAAWFTALRCLTIEHAGCYENDYDFLSSISPQLHEFSLSSFSSTFCSLRLEFSVARVIKVSCEQSILAAFFSVPATLKILTIKAEELGVHCKGSSPLSLDSLTLVGRKQLVVYSLPPLASVKTVFLNGPHVPEFTDRDAVSATQLLSTFAPTVKTLTVRHGWPLEDVDAEWSRLRCLGIGAEGRGSGGVRRAATVEEKARSRNELEAIKLSFILAPKLECIFFATRQWQIKTLASLPINFPSLKFYRIVGRSFHWKGEGERRNNKPVVQMRPDYAACAMKAEDMKEDDRMMMVLQTL